METRGASRWLVAVLGLCVLTASACGDGDEPSSAPERELRLPTSEELCALVTTEDFPGTEFRTVSDSGSVGPSGEFRFELAPGGDVVEQTDFVPADASCSWIGEPGETLSMMVLDGREAEEPTDIDVEALLPGAPLVVHPLSDQDGFDEVAVSKPAPSITLFAAETGPFVLVGNASLPSSETDDQWLIVESLLADWIELADR